MCDPAVVTIIVEGAKFVAMCFMVAIIAWAIFK